MQPLEICITQCRFVKCAILVILKMNFLLSFLLYIGVLFSEIRMQTNYVNMDDAQRALTIQMFAR